jgi:hypothetical protein
MTQVTIFGDIHANLTAAQAIEASAMPHAYAQMLRVGKG